MFNRRTILFGIFMYLSALTAHANGLTDLKDQPVEIKGPAVVNFWATWCAPCIKELPDLEILGQKLGSEATVYLVNFGETTKTIDTFKAKKPELFGEAYCTCERCQDVRAQSLWSSRRSNNCSH